MKRLQQLPNLLTWLRVILIPFIVLAFYFPMEKGHTLAAVIFIVAAVSDWFDGYFARKFEITTRFGAFLDPVADKVLVAVALVLLVSDPNMSFIAIPSMVIIAREIVVSALREWMAEIGKRASVAVSYVGKLKAACQMLAITFLLYSVPQVSHAWFFIGVILLYIAAILTIWSMGLYLQAAWKDLIDAQQI